MAKPTIDEMTAMVVAGLQEKTGRGIGEWIAMLRATGLQGRKEQLQWLKGEQGLPHVTASAIIRESQKPEGWTPPTEDALLDEQYTGDKAGLRPVYDRLAEAARKLGDDVSITPLRTYVPFARKRQFALAQASTRDRVDLGLALPGVEAAGRLREAGSLGSERITHRVELRSPEEVDDEVAGWLRKAYEAAAK
jgi:hypothetical protein